MALDDREGDTLTVAPPLAGLCSTGAEEWCNSCGAILDGGGWLVCLGCLRATGRCWCCLRPCFVATEAGLFVAPLVLAVLAVREAREAVGGGGCGCKPAAVLRLDRIFFNRTLAIPPDSESLGLFRGPLAATGCRCWF